MRRDLITSALADRRVHRPLRAGVSAGHDRDLTGGVPEQGRRQPARAPRQAGRLAPDRAGLQERNDHPHPRYFQSRPSVTGYNPAGTYFDNLGPNQKDLRDLFRKNIAAYLKRERPYDSGLTASNVPVDAVTTSASGVDPHISEANARIQARRVAEVRRLPASRVSELIDENTNGRQLGFLGEPGVNVLELNLALDRETS